MIHLDIVSLPKMGEGVHEATIVKFLKKVGDQVQKDEPLLQVSTDKVDTEIVAPVTGFLISFYVKEGDVVKVGQAITQISENPQAAKISVDQGKHSNQNHLEHNSRHPEPFDYAQGKLRRGISSHSEGLSTKDVTPSIQGAFAGFIRATPLARKLARENSISLGDIQGSGHHGRLQRNDVDEYIRAHSRADSARTIDTPSLKTAWNEGSEYLEGVLVRREPMSKIRRLTAEHMIASVRTSPHVTTTFEIDLFKVQKAKEHLRQEKVTYTAFFLFAAVQALKVFPYVNASVDGEEVLLKDDINIGCAVAIETGLIVPVIKKAQNQTLTELAKSLNQLVEKARSKQLIPSDITGGTFTLTNPGMYGSLHSQPIINQPQVAIMSVGAIIERPVVLNKKIEIRPLCQVGLTFDHRIIDGEGGAKFLKNIKDHLETFNLT